MSKKAKKDKAGGEAAKGGGKNAAAQERADKAAASADDKAGAGAASATEDAAKAEEAAADDPLAALQKQAEEYRENFLRARAEMENIQRRAQKQIADAHQFALTSFANSLGDVRDCLESALGGDAGDKMREGVELTLRKLVGAMDSHNILPIRPDVGANFDPQMHMAIGVLPPSKEAPAGAIAAVVQAGYMVNGRVVRAANVMVSQAAAGGGASGKAGGGQQAQAEGDKADGGAKN